MSDQADSQPQQTNDAPAQDQGGSAPDPIMSRLDELASSIQSLRPPEPDPEPEFDYAFDDSAYGQPEWDQPDDPGQQIDPQAEQDAWTQINQTIEQQARRYAQEAVTPYLTQQKAAQLEQKYPDLRQPEVASRIVQSAERFANMIGQSSNLSPDQVHALARNPELIERLYLAERAQRTAGQETPADGGPGAHLEGSSAQVETPEVDFFDRIANAGPNTNNRFGWT